MEKHSAQSLAQFFEMWFYKAGYPAIKASHRYKHKEKVLVITLEQSIVGASKGEEQDYFSFPLPVYICDAQDRWTKHSVEISQNKHMLTVTMDNPPKQIAIDPQADSVAEISYNPGMGMHKTIIKESPYICSKILAYRTMIKSGLRIAFKAVEEEYPSEASYLIRTEIAKSLAKSKTPLARRLIAKLLLSESHPLVSAALASSCAQHVHTDIAKALSSFLNRPQLPYKAHASALIAMAKQKDACDEAPLLEAVKDTGWWGFIRRSALTAWGHRKTLEAAALLKKFILNESELSHVRAEAINALAICASQFETAPRKDALSLLHAQLQNSNYKVRLSAVKALITLPDRSSIPLLKVSMSMFASQDHPIIKRAIRDIPSKLKTPITKTLEKRIDKLEKELKTLKDKMNLPIKGADNE